MCECRGEGDNERYFLQRITFKYYEDPFTRKETTNIDEYVRQIMSFINIYVMDFAQEQKIPIIVAHQRNGRAGFPEYIGEIRFDFANAQPGKELKKDTVLDFYNKTLNKFSDFLKIFKHLNNNHKTKTVAYWPPEKPEKSDFKCKMLGEKDENGKYPFAVCCCVPGVSQEAFDDFTSNFVNPMMGEMFRDIPEFRKAFTKDETEEEDDE